MSPGGTLTTLYVFCSLPGCADGEQPVAGLIQGSDGNFYGTTQIGGADNEGTVFKLTPGGALTTLYSFCSHASCADGEEPLAGVTEGTNGNFYGTTILGGISNLGTVFRLALTSSTTPPVIDPSGIVSSASFQSGIAPGSWITIFGTNLSAVAHTWADAIVDGNLPTSLYGVKVNVGSEPGYISYISPTQINVLAPSNLGTGTVPITLTNQNGTSTAVTASVQPVQPAFFQWGNYAVATTQDYSPAVKNGTLPGVISAPAKPGNVIILWGTGFGPTSPSAPGGVEVPSDTIYYTANPVAVTVGGIAATVYGAALAPGYAGLYQVAIQIPTSLADGDYPVVATVLGATSPSTTLITVQD